MSLKFKGPLTISRETRDPPSVPKLTHESETARFPPNRVRLFNAWSYVNAWSYAGAAAALEACGGEL